MTWMPIKKYFAPENDWVALTEGDQEWSCFSKKRPCTWFFWAPNKIYKEKTSWPLWEQNDV